MTGERPREALGSPRGDPPARIGRWKASVRRLREETHALYLAARDPRTPVAARIIVALVVAYALSPIDLIPDFVPVIGYLDDLVLLPLGLWLALRLVPDEVMSDCRAAARAAAARPAGRGGIWIVAGIWLACALLTAWWAWRAFGR